MADNQDFYVKLKIDTTQFDSSLQGMKKEMIALKGLVGNNLLSASDQQSVMKRLGELKGEFEDLSIASKSMDTGDIFANMAQLGSVAAGAVGGVTAAMGILGVESKMTQDIDRKLMMTIQLMMTLQQLADSKRLIGMIKMRAEQIKNLLTFKTEAVLQVTQIANTERLTVAQAIQTKGVGLATKMQLIWNAAMAANPIGLMIVAIAALGAALYGLYTIFKTTTISMLEYNSVVDETIKKQQELTESTQGDSIKAIREYMVATKELTQAEADRLNLMDETEKKKDTAKKSATDGALKQQLESDRIIKKIKDEGLAHMANLKIWESGKTVQKNLGNAIAAQEALNLKNINLIWGELRKQITAIDLEAGAKQGVDDIETKKAAWEKAKAIKEANDSIIKSTNDLYNSIIDNSKKILFANNIEVLKSDLVQFDSDIKNLSESYNKGLIDYKTYIDGITKLTQEKGTVQTDLTKVLIDQTNYETNLEIEKNRESLKKQIDDLKKSKLSKEKIFTETMRLNRSFLDISVALQAENTVKVNTILKAEQVIIDDNEKEKTKIIEEETKKRNDKKLSDLEAEQTIYKAQLDKNLAELGDVEKIHSKKEVEQAMIDTLFITQEMESTKNQRLKILQDEYNRIEILRKSILEKGGDVTFLDDQLNALKVQLFKVNSEYQFATDELMLQWKNLEKLFNPKTLTEQWVIDWKKVFDTDDLGLQISKVAEMAGVLTQYISNMFDTIVGGQQQALQQRTDESLNYLQEQNDTYIKGLDNSLKYGIISQEKYNDEKLKAEEELATKQKILKENQWKQEQSWNIQKAIIGIAQSVVQALASPPPMSYVMAALSASLGAVQLGIIKNTEMPEFGYGGMIGGPSHSSGGVPILAEGGEFMINKTVSQRPGMGDFLNKVNTGQISNTTTNNSLDIATIEAIVKGVASIPVVNIESQSTKVQRKVSTIEKNATW